MLSAVPQAGLEAVVVAVEVVLESGVVSVEHVLNVIGRLKQGPPAGAVETTLQVKEAPIADTERLDRLRRKGPIMREIAAELKALRLYGMASAWSELTGIGGQVRIESALWLIEHLRRCRRSGSGHAFDPLSDDGGPLPDPSGSGQLRLRPLLWIVA